VLHPVGVTTVLGGEVTDLVPGPGGGLEAAGVLDRQPPSDLVAIRFIVVGVLAPPPNITGIRDTGLGRTTAFSMTAREPR
jgi:hypothetical protein